MRWLLTISLIICCTFGQAQSGHDVNIDSLLTHTENKKLRKEIFRVQDSIVRKNIVGKWRDQNSTLLFRRNNTYSILFENGLKNEGFWRIRQRTLILDKESNGSFIPLNPLLSVQEYHLIYFTPVKMEFRLVKPISDPTIWLASKVEE